MVETEFYPKFGRMTRRLGQEWAIQNMFKILKLIFYDYDLAYPFLPQYAKNIEKVLYMEEGKAL